ncbi:MAG: 2-phospho-L-lactate transferase [Archaeoglobales archaeon]|nr:MAG: 2-phospho-L-lactate transferase [Archaeoglobales archaeon]
MIVVLSGGTGTPKLLIGLKDLEDFAVIVNTAEDIWISGNKVCPDIDSVIYALADVIDENKWWGLRGDSFRTHEMILKLGGDEFMAIGDLDRAVHIFRSELLRRGYTLTEATRKLRISFGVEQEVLPMCEEEVSTMILTSRGEMHFQEFWIKFKGLPEVLDVYFKGIENARATEDVLRVLDDCDFVLIGPSNPITSIMPILLVKGVKEMLREKFVIAVSPIVGKNPVSGPAGKFMRAKGYEVSPIGVVNVYSDFLDVLIVDRVDEGLVGKYGDVKIVSTNTIMKSRDDARRLAQFILKKFKT